MSSSLILSLYPGATEIVILSGSSIGEYAPISGHHLRTFNCSATAWGKLPLGHSSTAVPATSSARARSPGWSARRQVPRVTLHVHQGETQCFLGDRLSLADPEPRKRTLWVVGKPWEIRHPTPFHLPGGCSKLPGRFVAI